MQRSLIFCERTSAQKQRDKKERREFGFIDVVKDFLCALHYKQRGSVRIHATVISNIDLMRRHHVMFVRKHQWFLLFLFMDGVSKKN